MQPSCMCHWLNKQTIFSFNCVLHGVYCMIGSCSASKSVALKCPARCRASSLETAILGQLKSFLLVLQAVFCSILVAGNVHCLGCGKAFKEHTILAQHLKDKHQGRNADTTNTRAGMTLGDIMAQAQAKRAAAPAKTAGTERHQKQYSAFTPGDSRGMREYLKVCFHASQAASVRLSQQPVSHPHSY